VKFSFGDNTISVNISDHKELMTVVGNRLSAGDGFALATINLDHLVKLGQSNPFRTAYQAQDFVVADGHPIVWLAALAGRPVQLLPGSDLVVPLCRLAADRGLPVVFLGSTPEALAGAKAALHSQLPALVVTEMIAPPMGFDPAGPEAADILSSLASLGPALCFLALGAPKQEILAARGRKLAPQIGFASVGAGLDFLSGHQVRAPEWVRGFALEWLWRALSAPRRLIPRYAACAAILPGLTRSALRQRSQQP
jgi:N-acetylglucosaminyldiphosphoundecaprenol N-acetyl-beta-D-mannosaminyltransferase